MSEKADVADEAVIPPTTREELAVQVAELEETVQTLNNLLSSFSARMLRNVDDLKDEMNRRVSFGDLVPIQKDLERIKGRIDDVIDEVGYGESFDITKVPATILEAAYQAILDDVVEALKESRGIHDAEQHIQHSLEQLRMKTSGSELFHYRPHRLHVGVAKALEKGLVSARQVQMTYEELLRQLREPLHDYTPRNFRALIKIKSQEYAVDKALTLSKAWERAAPQGDALQERMARLEETVTGALRDLRDFAAKLQESLAGVATRESVEALGLRLAAMEQRLQDSVPPTREGASSGGDEGRVLETLSREARTLAALRKELGIDEDALRRVLENLELQGRISSTTRGRHTVYQTKEADDNA